MALIPPVDDQDLGDMAATFELVAAHMGFVPNSLKTMAHRPEIANAFMGLSFAVMGPGGVLPPDLRSLIGFAASAAHGCRYCQAHTVHSAKNAGIEPQKLAALWDYETSPLFSDKERAAMRFAQCAAQTPSMVGKAEGKALRVHFDTPEIAEITAVIALFGFLNRWNDTMGTALEDIPTAFADTTLAPQGWDAGKHA